MNRMVWILSASAILVATSACGSSDTGGDGSSFEAQIQGTWIGPCQAGVGDFGRNTFTASGLNYTQTTQHYTEGTCTVKAVPVDGPYTGSIVVGSAVTASLGSTSVTAYQITYTFSGSPGQTYYDLGYVDTAATPDRLYFGDSSGNYDGTTAARRPTTLGSSYGVKQ